MASTAHRAESATTNVGVKVDSSDRTSMKSYKGLVSSQGADRRFVIGIVVGAMPLANA